MLVQKNPHSQLQNPKLYHRYGKINDLRVTNNKFKKIDPLKNPLTLILQTLQVRYCSWYCYW